MTVSGRCWLTNPENFRRKPADGRKSVQSETRRAGFVPGAFVERGDDQRIDATTAVQTMMMRQNAFDPAQSVKGRKKVNELCHGRD